VKGAKNLRGTARAAAIRLASWREQEAVRRDRPRQWIFRDPVLLEIATRQPDSQISLKNIEGLAEKTAKRAGAELLDIVAQAKKDQSDYEPPTRPDEAEKVMLKKAQSIVGSLAAELGIAAELLAPKKELSAALSGARNSRVFRGWRAGLIGNELRRLFDS